VAGVFLALQPAILSRIVLGFRTVISGRYEQWCSDCGFLYQRFSSLLLRRSQPILRPTSSTRLSGANHGSIGDSWPIAFSGCPRGTRVGCETKRARGMPSLTTQLRLALEPECLKKNWPPWKRIPGMERIPETLKLFVVSGVWRRSSLLFSRQSMRWQQSSAPVSDAPSPDGCLWPLARRRTPGTGRP